MTTGDGDMELYDLEVVVDRIEGRSVCGMAVGDEVMAKTLPASHPPLRGAAMARHQVRSPPQGILYTCSDVKRKRPRRSKQ